MLESSLEDTRVEMLTPLRTDKASGQLYVANQVSPAVQYASLAYTLFPVTISVGFRRSIDFDAGDLPGQDSASLFANGKIFIGVIADGVSQSYFGHCAARVVCSRIMDALLGRLSQGLDAAITKEAMEEVLLAAQNDAAQDVLNEAIPDGLPSLVREVLEELRPSGSQAVVSAFVFDAENRTLALYQVGDVVALIRQGENDVVEVRADPHGRFSSAGQSKLLLEFSEFKGVTEAMLKSDGLSRDWARNDISECLSREKFVDAALSGYLIDDVSFVAAIMKPSSHETPVSNS